VSFKDKKLISSYLELRKKLYHLFYDFSLFERLLIIGASCILIISSFFAAVTLSNYFTTEIPKEGGEIIEGLLGNPRFVNPVLATSDTDRDLTTLLYSGLIKINAQGQIIPDLAESYSISEDGLTYYFKIKENAVFHDGEKVTSDDVIFTILKIQDPAIKSPRRPNWEGVRVTKISDTELEFNLSAPYAPFIFNTTVGILPQHKWESITSEEFSFTTLNTNVIGSGPYQIKNIIRDENEIINSYHLESFAKHTIKKPFITKFTINFYRTEELLIEALNKKRVQSIHSISPNTIKELDIKKQKIVQLPYSRIFALFFNQNKSEILSKQANRKILDTAIDRSSITETILQGYASNLYTPLSIFKEDTPTKEYGIEAAKKLMGTSTFEGETLTISTNNVPELIAVGEKIIQIFGELGLKAELSIKSTSELTNDVIRPREYQAILFGNVINRDLDYYAFWHSSQRNDPGLNISLYTSIESDKSLEQARSIIDKEEKLNLLQNFEKEVINDVPAIFLYSPDFIYIVPQIVQAQFPQIVVTSSDRFADVHNWYIETEKVWNMFLK
jgi:peptide/nickel transport system substrate-binding protein